MADSAPILDQRCVCGHERRRHFGPDGPCIAGTPSKEASVCACVKFEARGGDDGRS